MRKTLGVTLQSPQALTCHPHVCKHAHTQEHMHEKEEEGGGEKGKEKVQINYLSMGTGARTRRRHFKCIHENSKEKINETNVAPS